MPVLLGIDTGGTYTDAVLYDDNTKKITASAKSLTTHHDLALGIRAAATAAIGSFDAAEIALVGLSTTLATNALTEGRGGRVGLISLGFDSSTLDRGGIRAALDGGPALSTSGGHKADGSEAAPLLLDDITEFVRTHDDSVDAYAVISEFSVRNPTHELLVRDAIQALTARPVSVSHELSPRLGGPQRAVTTVLNGRLIALVDELLVAVRSSLHDLGIEAPLVIVRGDGSVLSDTATTHAPIETILSGPAASVIGAAHLVEMSTALVADIGGTTTDVAVMRDGRPRLNPAGASVGGHQTMVEAVDVTTIGLGGDSSIAPIIKGPRRGSLLAGPNRVVPISLLALDHSELVRYTLERQSRSVSRRESFAQFVVPTGRVPKRTLSAVEQTTLDALDGTAASMDLFIDSGARALGVEKLERAGYVRVAGFTATDAAHVLGVQEGYDREAAITAADLLAKIWTGLGHGPWEDGATLANDVMTTITRQSAELFLDVCLRADDIGEPGTSLLPWARAALNQTVGLTAPRISLTMPIIGLGASAATHHAGAGELLGTTVVVPPEAGVANAIGAVVGQVRTRREGIITQPHRGTYAIHGLTENARFQDLDEARRHLETKLTQAVYEHAEIDGANSAKAVVTWTDNVVEVNDKPYLVEAKIVVEAVGRPRHATH